MIKKLINNKQTLTPEKAKKLAKGALIRPTSYEDCLNDIELRAKRGYTWTYMLKVENSVIDALVADGWDVKIKGTNTVSGSSMIKINW